MFFAFNDCSSRSPYENLVDLCTVLVIAEEGPAFPLNRVLSAVNTALQKGADNGDVVVLATRALSLMLDKFPQSFSSGTSGTAKVLKRCFGTVFEMVKRPQMNLRHEKTTVRELKEELLNCLSLVSNYGEIASAVPSTQEQLKFCFGSLDGSKWTSCRVLRHCIALMRRGGLRSAGDHEAMVQLLQHHLSSLCNLDIDHEWDELLRTVVEGMLTYRVWCAAQRSVRRKRQRPSSSISSAPATDDVTLVGGANCGGAFSKNSMESLLAIGERIFFSGAAESRVQLTLACVSSLLDASCCSPEVTERALGWLVSLLQQNTARTAGYSSPFTHTRQDATKRDQLWAEPFQPLPNLQWIVPPLVWSALILLSKLCGANFEFCRDYIWAGRDDGGEYYPYPKDIRQELTAMFFAAEKNTKVLRISHNMDVRNMTDTCSLSMTVSRIHFQPIPSAITFDGKPVIPPTSISMGEKTLNLILDTLRSLSFGHSQTASLARALRLYVICGGAPTSSEGVIAAFRSLAAEHKRTVVEEISTTLMQRDKGWAPLLLEAGVVNFLTTCSPFTEDKEDSVAALKPQGACSVVELIRSAGSSPQLTSITLPPLKELRTFLCKTSPTELLAFVEALEHATFPTRAFMDVCTEIAKDPQLTLRLRAAVHTYVLRVLHQTSVIHQEERSLTDRVCSRSHIIGICRPDQRTANHMKCPRDHPLRVHFSVNWQCDICNASNAFGSFACRECDYDVCSNCSNVKLSRMDVSVSAVVGDIIRAWRDCQAKEGSGQNFSHGKWGHSVLFTSKGVLPTGRLSSTVLEDDVHFADVNGRCQCNIATPSFVADSMEFASHDNSALQVFLRTFGAQHQRGDIESAIVDVLESCGASVFEKGVSGIPERVSQVLHATAPYLSISFKRDTVHFLAIGCYRFGLYHLQDVNAPVRGTVMGDIESNGLATKFTVKRKTKAMTQTLFDAFLQYPTLRNKVEFNFEGEEGTGEGPTQELYAELSQRYRDMPMFWHEKEDGTRIAFPTLQQVFYKEFFVMGACCGRAFADGYTMSLGLLPLVWPFVRSRTMSAETRWNLFMELEPTLASSYKHLLHATDAELEAMELEDDEGDASGGGGGALLTTATVKKYVERRVERHLSHAAANLHFFALGLSSVVDLSAFWFLTDDEMSVILCGVSGEDGDERLFSEEALRAAVEEAHGYFPGSGEVATMIAIVGGEFTREQQQFFVEFLTGSPRLPLNGLAGLGRKITVVRKELEGKGELTLPSCSTCFLYFKLPPYTSRAIMKARLLTAITEGRRNFSLS